MAQETTTTVTETPADAPPPTLSTQRQLTDTLIFLGLMFGIFYFILIRPQQKRLKAHKEMLGGLKKGTRVVTGGGIIGTVVKADESADTVQVEIAPNVKVDVAKASLSEVLKDTKTAGNTANDN